MTLSRDTSALVDEIGVVTDQRIAGPLGEETQRKDDGEAVTIAFRAEEVHIRRSLLVQELEPDGLFDLGIFELHSGIVFVSVGVVFREHVQRLSVPVLRNQESW